MPSQPTSLRRCVSVAAPLDSLTKEWNAELAGHAGKADDTFATKRLLRKISGLSSNNNFSKNVLFPTAPCGYVNNMVIFVEYPFSSPFCLIFLTPVSDRNAQGAMGKLCPGSSSETWRLGFSALVSVCSLQSLQFKQSLNVSNHSLCCFPSILFIK